MADRKSYIEDFFSVIDWKVVSNRLIWCIFTTRK
jgi:superoxide dismutase